MNIKKGFNILSVFILFFILLGCKENSIEKIYMVPHSISAKAFGYETTLNLYYVSTYEIEKLDGLVMDITYDPFSEVDNYSLGRVTEVEVYEGYYVYQVLIYVNGLDGNISIDKISFQTDHQTELVFNTNIYLSSHITKDNHIYSADGEADIIFPGYQLYGLDFILSPEDPMRITNIYFESLSEINLNDYIDNILVNEQIFDGDIFLLGEDKFALEITFNDDVPYNGYLVDQLMVDYKDEDENLLEAYILVPLQLGSPIMASRRYIEYLIAQKER